MKGFCFCCLMNQHEYENGGVYEKAKAKVALYLL